MASRFDKFDLPRSPRSATRGRRYIDIASLIEDETGSLQVTQVTSTPYTLLTTDDLVSVTPTGVDITVDLYAANTFQRGIPIYIANSGSSGKDVIIDPNGAETIGGNSTHTLIDGEGAAIISDSVEWHIVGAGGGSAGGAVLGVQTVTGTYPATTANDVILGNAVSSGVTVDLFTAVGNTGCVLYIKKIDSSSNTVTIDGNSTETIDGATTKVLAVQYEAVTIVSDGTGWVIL